MTTYHGKVAPELAPPPPSPLTRLGHQVRSRSFWLLAYLVAGTALTAACLWGMGRTQSASPTDGCRLRTDAAGWADPLTKAPPGEREGAEPPGIVALQFAGKTAPAERIVERWPACAGSAAAATDEARNALRIDTFAFVPLYLLTLAWWCLFAFWNAYRRATRRLVGYVLAGVFLAGALDIVENLALFEVVSGHAEPWAAVATAATVPKWALLLVAVPTALAGLAGAVRRLGAAVLWGEGAQPQFYGPMAPGEGDIPPPLGPDDPDDARVARRSQDPHGQPWPSDTTGICFSGGGIRSASFALGALQALEEPAVPGRASVWKTADYLATVSGGGYTGTAAQVLAHQHPDGPPPLSEGSSEAEVIRDKRRYLWGQPRHGYVWKSTREFFSGVSLFLGGITFNVAVVVAAAYVLSHPLGWFARTVVFAGGGLHVLPPRELTAGLGVGAVLAALALSGVLSPLLRRSWAGDTRVARVRALPEVVLPATAIVVVLTAGFSAWAWLVVPLAAAGGRVVVRLGESALGRFLPGPAPAEREVPSPTTGAVAWFLLGLVATTAWYWTDAAFDLGTDGDVEARWLVAVAAVLAGLVVAVATGGVVRVPFDWLRRRGAAGTSQAILVVGFLVAVGFGVGAALLTLAALDSTGGRTVGPDLAVWSWVATALGAVYLLGDQKRWSPHPVYKDRLAKTFALTRFGPVDADRGQQAQRLPRRVRTTLSEWAAKPPHGPQLLICAAAYDSVERPADGLRAWPFVFSHSHVGGADVGWARTVDFEAVLGSGNQGDGTLQAAMAISGAALSPAIGRISLGSANALVAAANLRLGVWLPSPRGVQALQRGTPPVPTWVRTRRINHLFKEILGSYALDARFLYVTDGGQFDNLGLYELVARKCSTIYCFDASGDLKPDRPLSTNTFDQTRELIRRRLGVVFSLPGAAPVRDEPVTFRSLTEDIVAPDTGHGWPVRVPVAKANVTVLDMHYPDGHRGRLVYGKCVMTADMEGSVAHRYAVGPVGRTRFPADSTLDQWLDKDQFDAYVDLGRTVARLALAPATAIRAPSG